MPKKQSSVTHSAAAHRRTAKQSIRAKRSWPQRWLMHPTILFALLVVGVYLAGLTYHVFAIDYTVNAVVAAEKLQTGATITSPANNKVITTSPITVSGTCPNTSYIKLYRNGVFSGVAVCKDGTFRITTSLFIGGNDLQAQAYNVTDVPGPQTPLVHVTYRPAPTSSSAGNSSGTNAARLPMLLRGNTISMSRRRARILPGTCSTNMPLRRSIRL